jgi:hypothetical protein
MAAVRMDLPEFAMHVGTGDQVAISVKGHSVGAAGTLQKQGDLTGSGIPSVDPVVGLVSEEHVSISIDRGALGKAEALREGDKLPVTTHQPERIVDVVRVSKACQTAEHRYQNACVCLHFSNPSVVVVDDQNFILTPAV